MGLSLRNVGKKLEDLGIGASNIAGGVARQINPFDNNATYQNPNPAPIVHPSLIQQGEQLVSPTVQGTLALPGAIKNIAMTPVDLFRAGLGEVTHNPAAAQSAMRQVGEGLHTVQGIGQGVAQLPVRLGLSANPFTRPGANGQETFTPNTPFERFFLGDQPIQSYGTQFETNRKQGLAGAIGQSAATIGGDLTTAAAINGPGAKVLANEPKTSQWSQHRDLTAETRAQVGQSGYVPESGVKGGIAVNNSAAKYNALKDQSGHVQIPGSAPKEPLPGEGNLSERGLVDSSKPSIASKKVSEFSAQTKAGNKAALENSPGYAKESPLVNTAKNPTKVDIQPVQPGDYAKARSNGQLASKVVEFKGSQLLNSMQKLSADEKASFWKSVESPPKNASPALQTAISRWRDVANQAHATSQALGGNTNYIANYARHPWDLSGWDEASAPGMGSGIFQGINNMSRKHATIAEGEAAGLKLSSDPLAEAQAYVKASSSTLRKEALMKGLQEADKGQEAIHTADFGYGKTIPLSDQGLKEAQSVLPSRPTDNLAVRGYRTVNKQAKGTLLSASQFHPINVAGLRAAPGLALSGHPILAAQGLYDTFRSAVGSKYSDQLLQQAASDGTVEKAARIGMPIGSSDYSVDGSLKGGAIGEHTVFGKEMPAMHYAVAKGIISDLQDKGISLDSPEARQAGLTGNHMMGFVNQEVQGLDPRVQRGMSDMLLAPQFTRSKFELLGDTTKQGVAGKYARATVTGNVAATSALLAGVGYASHQKSDNARDILLRALISPQAATNQKDTKGNSVSIKTPATFTSEIAGLIGMKLVRGKDGHLGVSWKPQNLPSAVEDWMRSRLAIIPGTVVKVATNTSYAGKPLYDPNAPLGTQVQQGATTVGTGLLPIGLQGLAYTQAVKSHLPGDVQQVLDASTPGTNPLVKSIGSSLGLTPVTDKTVGKGQQSSQYFDALDQAKQGLDRRSADAFDLVTGSKKNPVTGAYDVNPTVYDMPAKANALLQNPKALQHLTQLNQQLASQGQQIDPFYKLTPDQQTKVLQIQRLDPLSNDKTQLIKQAGSWYTQLGKDQSAFFSSLPAGDPNKPKSPVQYQTPSPQDQALADKYYTLTDSGQKAAFIKANPNIQNVFDATSQYDKALRAARGLPQMKDYPQANTALQKLLDQYDTLDKSGRSALGKAHPEIYNYFQAVSQYNLPKQVAPSQYVGNDLTPQAVKAISSLGNAIYYNGGLQGSQGTIAPTGGTGAPRSGSSHRVKKAYNPLKYRTRLTNSSKKIKSTDPDKLKVAMKKSSSRLASSKGAKVTIKQSLV